jgi:hypothetical protein
MHKKIAMFCFCALITILVMPKSLGRTMASVCNERNIFFERPDFEPYKDVFDSENNSLRRKRSCQGRLIIAFWGMNSMI